jgi:AcrR family transcriptional regulator
VTLPFRSPTSAAVRGERTARHGAPRWRRRKAARPKEILDAALEMLVARGYAATKLEDIARRAGVSKGTMYLYFRNKESLFRAVVAEAALPAVERGEALAASFRGTSAELLRAILLDWWEAIHASPRSGLTKLMIAESGNFPDTARYFLQHVVLRRRRLLRRVLRQGMRSGEFRAVDLDLTVRLAVAPVLLASIWEHSFRARERGRSHPDTDRLIRLHADLFLAGIAAPVSGASSRRPHAAPARSPRVRAPNKPLGSRSRGGR